jgi:hypothetical protein
MNGLTLKYGLLALCLMGTAATAQTRYVGPVVAQFDASGALVQGHELMSTPAVFDAGRGGYVIKFSRALDNNPQCGGVGVPALDPATNRQVKLMMAGAGATKTEVVVSPYLVYSGPNYAGGGPAPAIRAGFVISCMPSTTVAL